MLAAAIDCAAVLERKLPEYAFALGAANEKALHLPQLAEAGLFRLYKGDETKQILLHMMSTEAVKVANPRAYDNGKNAIFLYDAITKRRGLVKSGAFDLSAFSKMNKKQLAGVASKFGSTAIQVFGEKTLEGFVMRLAEHLYETGMSE